MIRRWCAYLALLLGMTVLYLAHQQWLSWLLLVAVVLLPWLSLVLSLPAMLTTRMEAKCTPISDVSQRESLRVQVLGPLPVPLYRCRVVVERTTTAERWFLRPGDVRAENLLPAAHCGKLVCRLEKCRVYDYLGLFWMRTRRQIGAEMVVRPVPLPVKVPQELERQLAKSWRPKPGGGFAENHELRLYRPGDHLKQIHWKLSAKTGKLITREAMQPLPGRLLLTMDLCGSDAELDRKFGKLLWMGSYLLEQGLRFEIHMLTAEGLQHRVVAAQQELVDGLDAFLGMGPAPEGTVLDRLPPYQWQFYIGGDPDEE